jgi:hypothetical protein
LKWRESGIYATAAMNGVAVGAIRFDGFLSISDDCQL